MDTLNNIYPISYSSQFFLNLIIHQWSQPDQIQEKLIINTVWATFSELFFNIISMQILLSDTTLGIQELKKNPINPF